ncbi:MAG: SRPBCC domain-containing protein [Proteobacteria bacterium]|nr:SRPBCC domain-containing protein [Pseudomonadota bacterium]
MTLKTPPAATFERRYQASVAELWALWTTKEGFESWWGPQGFRVVVHRIEPRAGGALVYDMIAVGAQEIAYMKNAGMAVSHGTHGTFADVVRHRHLELVHVIDFVPGLPAYEHRMRVEFFAEGRQARMIIQVEPHSTTQWTQASLAGMESQLTKLPALLGARAAR